MKREFRRLIVALAWLAGVDHAPAQTTNLGISLAGTQVVISWPAAATNYVLQSTANLTSPNWVTITNAVPGAAYTFAINSSASFFRLNQSNVLSVTADGMALVPAGSFTMGDSLDGESDAVPTVTVSVSAFYMDTNLVSYGEWQSVYNSAVNAGYGFDNAGSGKTANNPVYNVDWYDSVKWCNARSQSAGFRPLYYTDMQLTEVYTNGETDAVYVDWLANGYRLPTEAEWEKAARGGLSAKRFPWGDTISETRANYFGDTADYSYDLGPDGYNFVGSMGGEPDTSPVGSFAPNNYDLYDMAGNVWEWCWDWYGTPYAGGGDPRGPASGSLRVLRGGYWHDDASNSRCAYRNNDYPSFAYNYGFGFRCVRLP